MGAGVSRCVSKCSPPRRAGQWNTATSDVTVASLARLEALANVGSVENAKMNKADLEKIADGCRLAYSSVLHVKSAAEAQDLLALVFTQALNNNPKQGIGGILFYDEQSAALVQVLEGPSSAVRTLYHEKIKLDPRHTSVKLLWDQAAESRQYEGFGMQLGSDPTAVLSHGSEMLQLTYVSQLTASDRDAAYKDIQAILAVAIITNPRLGIGGALFLNPRTLQVLQALEGPEANVRTLYEKIAKDRRHTACTTVSEIKGDLKDWSSIAAGKVPMASVSKSRRRVAREDMEDDGGEKKLGGVDLDALQTPSQDTAIKGEVQMADGKPVVVVGAQ